MVHLSHFCFLSHFGSLNYHAYFLVIITIIIYVIIIIVIVIIIILGLKQICRANQNELKQGKSNTKLGQE